MTAQQIIDSVAFKIRGLKVSDTSIQSNKDTLLAYLNEAKNQLAIDTSIWLGGEIIAMTTDNEYTLAVAPIQIIDVYDDELNIRPRNSNDRLGYYQTSPQKIYVNQPEDGLNLNINYYYAPDDYIITDTVDIHPNLIRATELYMQYLAYEVYKGDSEQVMSNNYFTKYKDAVNTFMTLTDNGNVDSISDVDQIKVKGFV